MASNVACEAADLERRDARVEMEPSRACMLLRVVRRAPGGGRWISEKGDKLSSSSSSLYPDVA